MHVCDDALDLGHCRVPRAVFFPTTLLATSAANGRARSTCTQLAPDNQKLGQICLGETCAAEERRHWRRQLLRDRTRLKELLKAASLQHILLGL